MLVFQQFVKESSFATFSNNTVTQKMEKKVKTPPLTLKSKKAEEETDTRNESERSPSKQIIKEENKIIPQTSGSETIVATETEKATCSTNHETIKQQSEELRLLENIMSQGQIWPTHEVKLVKSIHKPPHLRSKVSIVTIVQFMVIFRYSEEVQTNLLCYITCFSLKLVKLPMVLQFQGWSPKKVTEVHISSVSALRTTYTLIILMG
jgi:hypothetical protein